MVIKDGIIYVNDIEIGGIKHSTANSEGLFLNGHGFAFDNYPELKIEWDKIYPNGKPVPEVEPQLQPISEERKYKDMIDFLMKQFVENEAIKVI